MLGWPREADSEAFNLGLKRKGGAGACRSTGQRSRRPATATATVFVDLYGRKRVRSAHDNAQPEGPSANHNAGHGPISGPVDATLGAWLDKILAAYFFGVQPPGPLPCLIKPGGQGVDCAYAGRSNAVNVGAA